MAVLNWTDITSGETGTEVNTKLNNFNSEVELAANGNLTNILAQQLRIEALENEGPSSPPADPQVGVNQTNISNLTARVGLLEYQHPEPVTPPTPVVTGKRMLQEAASEEIENAYSKSWSGGQPIAFDLGEAISTKRVSFNLDILKTDGSQNSYTIRLISSQVRPMIKLIDVLLEDWTPLGYDDFLIAVDTEGKLTFNIITQAGSGELEVLLSNVTVSLVN